MNEEENFDINDIKPSLGQPLVYKGKEKFECATEGEKQYLAGLFDADGSFGIAFQKKQNYYRPKAILGQTSSLPQELAEKWGGQFYLAGLTDAGNSVYHWEIKKHELLQSFLKAIIPYLRIKQKQAKLLVEALNTPQKDREKPANLKIEISALNDYFPPVPPEMKKRYEYLKQKFLEQAKRIGQAKNWKDLKLPGQGVLMVSVSIPEAKKAMIKHVRSLPNKSKYIQNLIERDMKKTDVPKTKEELVDEKMDIEQQITTLIGGEKYRTSDKEIQSFKEKGWISEDETLTEDSLARFSLDGQAYIRGRVEYKRDVELKVGILTEKAEKLKEEIEKLSGES